MGNSETAVYERRDEGIVRRPSWAHARNADYRQNRQVTIPEPTSTQAFSLAPADGRRATGGRPKRCFDLTAAILAIILLAPLFLLIAIAIKFADRGPVFFRHQRIGWNGKPFHCFKFRTMAGNAETLLQQHLTVDAEARREWVATQKLKHDPRVTPLGHGLRKTSLDELPQLLNILRGEMSFVGPRPIVTAEVVRYGPSFSHYLAARPGLTGPWQVSGRNDVDYSRRVMFDRQYVEEWSFWRDLIIIVKTFRVVVSARGCY